MDTNTDGGTPTPFSMPIADGTPASYDVDTAAKLLTESRNKVLEEGSKPPAKIPTPSAPGAKEDATLPDPDSLPESDATPEEIPDTGGEDPEAPDPEDNLPPIELPRSWAKEQAAVWADLPRPVQQHLTDQAKKDSDAVRKSQNEAAEIRKASETERTKAEQARTQFEAILPQLQSALEESVVTKYPNIKTMADVEYLAQEQAKAAAAGDTATASQIQAYLTGWQVEQQKLNSVRQAKEAADNRQTDEAKVSWVTHRDSENAKFFDAVPEAEREAVAEMRKKAPAFLEERGFSKADLDDLSLGKAKLSLYDHRVQGWIKDSMKLAEIQNAPKVHVRADVPPVAKPGAPRAAATGIAQQIKALEVSQTKVTGEDALRIGAQILALQRKQAASRTK